LLVTELGPPWSDVAPAIKARLVRAEAALRSIERALDALFRRINVNRKRDPELDAVIDALAAIRHGLDHARGDRSKDVEPEHEPLSFGADADEDEESVRVHVSDARGRRLAVVLPTKLPEN
jgi:hypothetical protein